MKRCDWTAPILTLVLFGSLSLGAEQPAAAEETGERWQATTAALVGGAFGAGEIGRDTNATGGELLLARLPDGPLLALRANVEGQFLALGVECASLQLPIEVENDGGVDFPHHGTQPFLYSVDVELYPAGRGLFAGRLRPYLGAGLGGAVLSVDLDNRRQQELTHHWLWKASGGLRWRRGADGDHFLDVRYEAYQVTGRGPIADFSLRVLALGYGVEL